MTASDGCLVARVSGELDYVGRPVLMEKLRQVIARGHRFIVLDLSGVTFCDSAGLNVLLLARLQAELLLHPSRRTGQCRLVLA